MDFASIFQHVDPLVIITLIAAIAFDYVNGFHDAANSIATVVATRVLSPRFAVAWAAFFNFAALFVVGTAVAKMVGKDVVDLSYVTTAVIFSGLTGAIVWNLITWWFGLPSSSSHALVGGYAGAALARSGIEALKLAGIGKIAAFIVIAPIIGMILGMANQIIVTWIVRKMPPGKLYPLFRKLQLLSSAVYSFSHGSNDAQKTMGIIFALLLASGIPGNVWGHDPVHPDSIPLWIEVLCYAAIAAGTLSGGLRIVKTMGTRLTKLDPMHGFSAETGGGVTILGVSFLGIPVSTTHTITGAIIGVGMVGGLRSVRWILARKILWAWLFTIPASGLFGWGIYRLMSLFGHN
ncbi:MAG TPA: inorganic phosphate transporter [Myxococcota bacterium]|nr:inorganic phosphate transporter [Myxococcota bacterium]HOA13836.1 inorganic phosphate transporter [Myxococcota bacterium]HOC98511.1 inorganic phosphate transporter [Myxococcota bacterium]HOH76939.1 inorganic phosphate transporter [Myxococcota bacterium]HPV03074.1 inorganic phosphate transporter [Myxococcota bacterium]